MSLEKKVRIGMFAALAGTACSENSMKLDGVIISEAVTDSEGKTYFTEAGTDEEVEVRLVKRYTDFPVADASVLYFDDHDFKAFLLNHDAFSPQLRIAEHNSNHKYSLTSSPLQVLHDSFKKEKSKPAAEDYLSWAEAHWEYTGCLNRENMLTLMKPGAYLMKKFGIIETIGFSEDKFDEGVQYIEDNLPESAVADMYVFIPYEHGFSASTTTITALEVRFDGKCSDDHFGDAQPGNDYGSGGNNNSNNNNNNGGSDCPGMLFCDDFEGTGLNTGKWNIVQDSGIAVSGGWLSLPNASSIAAQNQFGNSCIDKQVDLRSASYLGSVYLGNMGLSANNDTGILNCEGNSEVVSIAGAENGLSLYKSEGLLSLFVNGEVTSIPCSEDISYVQLTAGLNDLVKIDYVKIGCK